MQPLKLIFAGTPHFAVPSLRALVEAGYEVVAVYTQPDRPAGRGHHLAASPIKLAAQRYGIPVYQPDTLKNSHAQTELQQLQADLMIVAAYGLILPGTILQIPRYGCINVHASLLPRWRGAAPIQRAILAGDLETGITIMQMDKGLDTGNMLYKLTCSILPDDNAQTLHDRLAVLGGEALLKTLSDLQQQALNPIKQDDDQACYAPKLIKAEAHLNWQLSAASLARAIRAYQPWPTAFTFYLDKNIKIWRAVELLEKASVAQANAMPGTIINIQKQGIDVMTGEGILRLQELQMPGGRVLTVEQLLNAPHSCWQVGKQFV